MNFINEHNINYIIGFFLLLSIFFIYKIIKIWKKESVLKKQINHEKEFIAFMEREKESLIGNR